MKVQELMTTNVARVGLDDSLAAAAGAMWDADCGAVPVLDGGGRVVGMITDRDICMAAWSRNCAPAGIAVSAVMSWNPSVCRPTDTVHAAERLMREGQIRRLPVVDADQRLVGILSLADIARAAESRPQPGRSGPLAADDVSATLAGIVQPHREAHA